MGEILRDIVSEWMCFFVAVIVIWIVYLIMMGIAHIAGLFCFGGY